MGLFQGMLGNLQEVTGDELAQKYAAYLIAGESIQTGFKLVRDTLVITDLRIISFDKEGATGKKWRGRSIHLDSICEVSCETAGFGLDDCELTISYIKSPYRRSNEIMVVSKTYEFPKKFNVARLYVQFEAIAQENLRRLNE